MSSISDRIRGRNKAVSGERSRPGFSCEVVEHQNTARSTATVGHRTIHAGANGLSESAQESHVAGHQTDCRFRVQEGVWQPREHPRSDRAAQRHPEACRSDLQEETISSAPAIEQWAFFFLFADRYEPERLRELLPGVEFQRAISVVETIAAKTEDRMMYDQRLKAQRDYQWGLDSARQEGMEKGLEKGREEGMEKGESVGKIQILQELLGDAPSSTTSLRERTTGELSTMLADLQQRLRSRES
jgi:hypothetical protein